MTIHDPDCYAEAHDEADAEEPTPVDLMIAKLRKDKTMSSYFKSFVEKGEGEATVRVEYDYAPAGGDDRNEPRYGASVEIIGVVEIDDAIVFWHSADGIDITDTVSDSDMDRLTDEAFEDASEQKAAELEAERFDGLS